MSESDHSGGAIELLRQLAPHVERVGRGSFTGDGLFRCVLRASLVKAFEFTVFAQNKHPEPFFLTATFRGMCEDLIVLSFLESLPDRDDIVTAVHHENTSAAMSRQRDFFNANRSWQPVVGGTDEYRQSSTEALKKVATAHGWPRNRLPTVRAMAESCGLLNVYDFMYSATSEWVHFNPHLLLRMGWSNEDRKNEITPKTCWSFSTKHFAGYYNDFNRVYSIFLLHRSFKKFISEFDQPGEVGGLLDLLDKVIKDDLRWPELVTYEELNYESPGPLLRILLRVKAEHKENVAT